MSEVVNSLPKINTSLELMSLRNIDFGGFQTDTEAGKQLLAEIANCGVVGAVLASLLDLAGTHRREDEELIAAMEEGLRDSA